MFDFRYHALSLTAVIVALVLGLLLGVAIGDKGLLSSSEKKIREQVETNVKVLHQRNAELVSQLGDRKDVEGQFFPLIVSGELTGRSVGILFLGPSSNTDKDLIHDAIDPAGATVSWVMALNEPLDVQALSAAAGTSRYDALVTSPDLFYPFGRRIGTQLVIGGKLVTGERSALAESFNGQLSPVDTIIIARRSPDDIPKTGRAFVASFEKGIARGLVGAGATVVGVQTQNDDRTRGADWYSDQHLTYVSNIDQVEGRVSLVFALAGLSTGRFGRGSGEQLVPDVPEVVTTP